MKIQHFVALVVLSLATVPGARAATTTWTGADPSGYWSAPANWSPTGVPFNGDDLVFPGGLQPGDMVSTNDLPGSFFRSITFNQGSTHTIRGNPMTLTNRVDCIINSGTNVMACDLTFSGTPPTPTGNTIRGPFFGSRGELTVIGNVGGDSLYIGYRMRVFVNGQFTGGSLRVAGGTLALYGDNPNAVSADLWGGTLLVQGSHPNLNITLRYEMEEPLFASLSGDGLVGDVTALTSVTRITPDSTLSVKNISGGLSTLLIRLNGTNVGEYSRLVASGNVHLSTGSLLPSPGFNPQPGQVFTIIEKTSPGPITNAIFGPEGTLTTLNGIPFRLSYVGGDGNDVTLTATAQVNYAVSGNTAYVTSSPNAAGNIVIASTFNGYPVTSIAGGAFYGCTSLINVTIPNSVTSIGGAAFSLCRSLTNVAIPNSVASIGPLAFSNCISLTIVTIPNGVTNIASQAFRDCWGLASVTIPNSVTTIGGLAFSRCHSLTNLSVDAANPAYSSLDGVLFNKAQTTLITYPGARAGSYVIPNSVTTIRDAAFSDSANLTSVTIPDSVTSLGYEVFYSSRSLTGVTIGNGITSIAYGAFWNCTNLTSVTIPNSVISIDSSAFDSCRSLTSVTIPNSVTYIGWFAFYHCTSLTKVTIPNSVTGIGGHTFEGSTSLTNFTFLGNAPGYFGGAFYNVGAGARAYYYCGTTGWGPTYDGMPTVMLCPPGIAPGGAGVKPGGFGFTLTRLTNQNVVEASTDLLNWQPIWTNTPPGASAEFVDPEWLNHSNRFYRARSE